jgi:hypothetical protein
MPFPRASQALSRFTVLDLTRVRSGPTCVRQLADWGANVIKIDALMEDAAGEQPGGPPDLFRSWDPMPSGPRLSQRASVSEWCHCRAGRFATSPCWAISTEQFAKQCLPQGLSAVA